MPDVSPGTAPAYMVTFHFQAERWFHLLVSLCGHQSATDRWLLDIGLLPLACCLRGACEWSLSLAWQML